MRRAKVANNKFWKGRIEFWTNGRGFEPKEIRAERDCISRMRREKKMGRRREEEDKLKVGKARIRDGKTQ